MKDIFIIWITIQLMFIGITFGEINNQTILKTFNCSPLEEEISLWLTESMPLVAFVPRPQFLTDYCNNQKK